MLDSSSDDHVSVRWVHHDDQQDLLENMNCNGKTSSVSLLCHRLTHDHHTEVSSNRLELVLSEDANICVNDNKQGLMEYMNHDGKTASVIIGEDQAIYELMLWCSVTDLSVVNDMFCAITMADVSPPSISSHLFAFAVSESLSSHGLDVLQCGSHGGDTEHMTLINDGHQQARFTHSVVQSTCDVSNDHINVVNNSIVIEEHKHDAPLASSSSGSHGDDSVHCDGLKDGEIIMDGFTLMNISLYASVDTVDSMLHE
ncbi:uncharacterized protein LAESUDRAFT_710268 [Laetiporus sulphureus 93-53]|uniref:Uncharacterized protein n=1 Tax=Laetiporus sulphureus 93-53 TaxID=1314785 RepID=A0A165IL43_9APHY|nr:uncharacterized protein LAESUDRAFT_710268 [Laetiporus sulphureus 93-53]KZT13232.1 hypothetical protein LAESUDRAFT_710268 [Laetiporus sulphureus 93-53]